MRFFGRLHQLSVLAAAFAASAFSAGEPKGAEAPPAIQYGEPRQLATLADPAIGEKGETQ